MTKRFLAIIRHLNFSFITGHCLHTQKIIHSDSEWRVWMKNNQECLPQKWSNLTLIKLHFQHAASLIWFQSINPRLNQFCPSLCWSRFSWHSLLKTAIAHRNKEPQCNSFPVTKHHWASLRCTSSEIRLTDPIWLRPAISCRIMKGNTAVYHVSLRAPFTLHLPLNLLQSKGTYNPHPASMDGISGWHTQTVLTQT